MASARSTTVISVMATPIVVSRRAAKSHIPGKPTTIVRDLEQTISGSVSSELQCIHVVHLTALLQICSSSYNNTPGSLKIAALLLCLVYSETGNRISVLSEVYSHLDFEERTRVSRALVLETIGAAVESREEILKLTSAADTLTTKRSTMCGQARSAYCSSNATSDLTAFTSELSI